MNMSLLLQKILQYILRFERTVFLLMLDILYRSK